MNNTLEARVLDAIPGYTRTINRSKNATEALANRFEAKRAPIAFEELKDRIAELLDAGEPIPLDIAADAAQAELDDHALDLRAGALQAVIPTTRASRDTMLQRGAGAATEALARELTRVVETVVGLEPHLRGVFDAGTAIAAGDDAVNAWKLLGECVNDYDQIRKLQHEIYRANLTQITQDITLRVSLVAESLDVVPYYVDRRNWSADNSGALTAPASAYKRWLRSGKRAWEPTNEASWWPTESREKHLLHVATQLHPWVPAYELVEKLIPLAGRASGPVTLDIPRAQEVAREEYYQLTAVDPGIDTTPSEPRKVNRQVERAINHGVQQVATMAAQERANDQPTSFFPLD